MANTSTAPASSSAERPLPIVGRALATEVMIPNMAVRNLIREDKIHQIYSSMQSGQEESGMTTMNQSLALLVKQGVLSKQDAIEHSPVPEELHKLLLTVKERG